MHNLGTLNSGNLDRHIFSATEKVRCIVTKSAQYRKQVKFKIIIFTTKHFYFLFLLCI